jgi:YVTN family beta-propeller protein
MSPFRLLAAGVLWVLAVTAAGPAAQDQSAANSDPEPAAADVSPTALAVAKDGRMMYIACATAGQVLVFDTTQQKVTRHIPVQPAPLGLALSPDGSLLFVACAGPSSAVHVILAATGRTVGTIPAGHWAIAPVVSPDSRRLYVCNRFSGAVSVIDLAEAKTVQRIPVAREPIAAALTPDGRFLLVAHHLHEGRANAEVITLPVSVIDTATSQVIKEIALPNGATLARDIRISPDGRYACVTHLLARFELPTTQIERGWMNSNALTLIDLTELKPLNTVLLDDLDRGAATPYAITWTTDGRYLCVTHAGTHELSVIAWPSLLDKLIQLPAARGPSQKPTYPAATRTAADVASDLSFLVGLRQRIKLGGLGPRAVAAVGNSLYVGEYFSDSLSRVTLDGAHPVVDLIRLGPRHEMSPARKGEFLFNDASICFQNWQSCASCHSSDARIDGLDWDLLNDGINNPKNNKSLLLAHQTPPSMAHGVRADASAAVRAGVKYILFANRPDEEASALDEFLKSLTPVPSPYLVNGKLSPAAERGKALFLDDSVGCAVCHPAPLFCDLKIYNVGTLGKFDKAADRFDTPTLVEVWRTAPYLHDGSAATLREVLTTHNPNDQHGRTSHLSEPQLTDLLEFVRSL